jgi:hypothetical protein
MRCGLSLWTRPPKEAAAKNIEMIAQFRRVFFAGASAALVLIGSGERENLKRDIEAFFKGEDQGK